MSFQLVPVPLLHTHKIVYCLLNAWVLSHPLLSRQLPSNSSIPLYSHTIVNNYHALLSLLPVWSAAHTTWVSPLPYFSAHCARTLPPLRSLRCSLFGAVEGQGGKLRLPLMPQKLLRTFSVMSLPTASPFPQQHLQWVRPGNAASWTFGLFMPLTRAPSSGWTGSS